MGSEDLQGKGLGVKMGLKFGLILSSLLICIAAADTKSGKFLFEAIVFNNNACTATTGEQGWCRTSLDCAGQGGIDGGPCDTAFGVCCVVKSNTCGSSLNKNNSYIAAPDDLTVSTCEYTIKKESNNICQYRLDFETFDLAMPESVATAGLGRCVDEKLEIVDGDGVSTPTICGDAQGQHMYLAAGPAGTATTLTFTGPFRTATDFSIKVTQIECSSPVRAPDGCLQYFTEETGTIESFNFQGDHLLENMDYTICIRDGESMCGIRYTEDPSESEPFRMSTREWTAADMLSTGAAGPLQGDHCSMEAFISIINGYTATSNSQTSGTYELSTLSPVSTISPRHARSDIMSWEEEEQMLNEYNMREGRQISDEMIIETPDRDVTEEADEDSPHDNDDDDEHDDENEEDDDEEDEDKILPEEEEGEEDGVEKTDLEAKSVGAESSEDKIHSRITRSARGKSKAKRKLSLKARKAQAAARRRANMRRNKRRNRNRRRNQQKRKLKNSQKPVVKKKLKNKLKNSQSPKVKNKLKNKLKNRKKPEVKNKLK